jgi:hypothetical protein
LSAFDVADPAAVVRALFEADARGDDPSVYATGELAGALNLIHRVERHRRSPLARSCLVGSRSSGPMENAPSFGYVPSSAVPCGSGTAAGRRRSRDFAVVRP